MTDSIEHVESEGLSRRSLLRRGALVGGAMVWTVPTVQTIASFDLAAAASVNGDGGTGTGTPSYVYTWISCAEVDEQGQVVEGGIVTYYSMKWTKPGEGKPDVFDADAGEAGELKNASQSIKNEFNTRYNAHDWSPDDSHFDVTASKSSEGLFLTLPAGCRIISWFLHDGSCLDNKTGADKWRWDGDGELPQVGPEILPTPLGFDQQTFKFTAC